MLIADKLQLQKQVSTLVIKEATASVKESRCHVSKTVFNWTAVLNGLIFDGAHGIWILSYLFLLIILPHFSNLPAKPNILAYLPFLQLLSESIYRTMIP